VCAQIDSEKSERERVITLNRALAIEAEQRERNVEKGGVDAALLTVPPDMRTIRTCIQELKLSFETPGLVGIPRKRVLQERLIDFYEKARVALAARQRTIGKTRVQSQRQNAFFGEYNRKKNEKHMETILAKNLESSPSDRGGAVKGDDEETNPLDAIGIGFVEIVRLIQHGDVDVDYEGRSGLTPLVRAVDMKKMVAMRNLRALGADIDHESRYGLTPLLAACLGGDIVVVDEVLKLGADPDHEVSRGNFVGMTALIMAAKCGRVDVIKVLCNQRPTSSLTTNANINRRNRNGSSALLEALKDSSLIGVHTLLRHGAHIQLQDSGGKNATMYANQLSYDGFGGFFSMRSILKQTLIQNGGNDVMVTSQSPPATYADKQLSRALERTIAALEKSLSRNDMSETIRLLKKEQAAPSPNYETRDGWTPLRKAAFLLDTKSAAVLLGPGVKCDVNYLSKYRTTAMMTAATCGSLACVLLFLEHGADFKCCDAFGMTPRMYAAGCSNMDATDSVADMCRVLVESEAHNDAKLALKLHTARTEESQRQDEEQAKQDERTRQLRHEYEQFKEVQAVLESKKPMGSVTNKLDLGQDSQASMSEDRDLGKQLFASMSTPSMVTLPEASGSSNSNNNSCETVLNRMTHMSLLENDGGSLDTTLADMSASLRGGTLDLTVTKKRDFEKTRRLHDQRAAMNQIRSRRRGGLASTYGSLSEDGSNEGDGPEVGGRHDDSFEAEDDNVQYKDPLTGAIHVLKESKKRMRKEIIPCQRCQQLKARNRCVQCRLLLCDRCWVDIHGIQDKSHSKHQAILIVANDIVVQIDAPNKNKNYLAGAATISDREGGGHPVTHGSRSNVAPSSFATAAHVARGVGKLRQGPATVANYVLGQGGGGSVDPTVLSQPHVHSKALTKAEYVGTRKAQLKTSTSGALDTLANMRNLLGMKGPPGWEEKNEGQLIDRQEREKEAELQGFLDKETRARKDAILQGKQKHPLYAKPAEFELATFYLQVARFDEAIAVLIGALEMQRKHLEKTDPLCILTLQKIGSAVLQFQKHAEAKRDVATFQDSRYIKEDASLYFSEAIDISVRRYGHNHEVSIKATDMCGDALLQSARFENTIQLFYETSKQRAAVFGHSHACVLQAKEKMDRAREMYDTHLMEQEDLISMKRAQEDRTREEFERQKSGHSKYLLTALLITSKQGLAMAQGLLKAEMKRENDTKEAHKMSEKFKKGGDAKPPIVHKPAEYRQYRKVDYDHKGKRRRRFVGWFSDEARQKGYANLDMDWEPSTYADEAFYDFSRTCHKNLGTDMLIFWVAVEWFKTLKAGTFEFSRLCGIIHKKFVRPPAKMPCLPASVRNDVSRALVSAVVVTTPDVFDECQAVVFETLFEGHIHLTTFLSPYHACQLWHPSSVSRPSLSIGCL
jgi:ankyrin repeat protein